MQHGPSYPPPTLSSAAVRLFATRFRSKAQVCALLGFDPKHSGYSPLWRWSKGRVRPSSRYLRRMARLTMWELEGYPVEQLTRVDWDGMTMEWENGGRNLFELSPSSNIKFPFGGLRDGSALLFDLRRLQEIVYRADLARLLGLGRRGSSTIYRWVTVRDRRPGPIMICRVLILTLWAARGVRLADIWSVDWTGELIEWRHGAPPTPPAHDPFRSLLGGVQIRPFARSPKMRHARSEWGMATVGIRPGSPYQNQRDNPVVRTQLPSPTRATPVFDGDTVAPTESPPAPR